MFKSPSALAGNSRVVRGRNGGGAGLLAAHYVTGTNTAEIAEALRREPFISGGEQLELVHFFCWREAPNILVSQGSGGHPYLFAELGHLLNEAG
jgi:hypothetical protein